MAVIYRSICIFLAIMLVVSVQQKAYAEIAESPCDADYYEALSGRAWMEAQREVSQNQNIIYRPDSVLEYTCFDKHLGVLAKEAVNMFSESQRWGGVGISSKDMDKTLSALISNPLNAYQAGTFPTRELLLDGRSEFTYEFLSAVVAGDYNCSVMNTLWQEAKCRDFAKSPTEGFLTFAQIQENDPRSTTPAQCSGTERWAAMEEAAYKTAQQDSLQTYLDRSKHECGKFPAIPTGVVTSGGSEEKVCVQPGCIYKASRRGGGARCVPSKAK